MNSENKIQSTANGAGATLADCESEQLHRSGAIQSHGAMVVVGEGGLVTHASDNIQAWLQAEPARLIGKVVPAPLDALVRRLDVRIAQRGVDFALGLPGRSADVITTRARDGSCVVELLPAAAAAPQEPAGPALAFDSQEAAQRSRQALVEQARLLLGMDRVMYYQFVEDDDGVVSAESRDEAVYGSYLDLRFPASDIPQIARAMYRDNPWRLIVDCEDAPVAVVAASSEPPDLSFADLRSASPIHCEYLRNMNVRTSLSFPVRIDGKLSALIACHSARPRLPSIDSLQQVSRRVDAHAQAQQSFDSRRRMDQGESVERAAAAMVGQLQSLQALQERWPHLAPRMIEALGAHSAALRIDGRTLTAGEFMDDAAVHRLDAWLEQQALDPVWSSDSLVRDVPGIDPSHVCGVMAARIRHAGPAVRLYIGREEFQHEVSWGGRPDKPVERTQRGSVAPRRSFEQWIERRTGRSRPWTEADRMWMLALRRHLMMALPQSGAGESPAAGPGA